MDKPPGFVLILWPLIDAILCRYHHIRPLGTGSGIMAVEFRCHKGHTITLADGFKVRTGDPILELHINNNWFKKRRKLNLTTSHLTQEVLVYFAQDLSILAKQIDNGIFGEVVALHGCTHLGIGARRLGFQVEELPDTLWKKWAEFYLAGLIEVYNAKEHEELRSNMVIELKEVWLSKPELLRRYGFPK
jgi:hypothetical protein